jgi:Family of unknown function (DUF5670)
MLCSRLIADTLDLVVCSIHQLVGCVAGSVARLAYRLSCFAANLLIPALLLLSGVARRFAQRLLAASGLVGAESNSGSPVVQRTKPLSVPGSVLRRWRVPHAGTRMINDGCAGTAVSVVEESTMFRSSLLAIAAILVVFWVVGLAAHILGAAIHAFLVVAIIVALGSFILGRESA